MANLKRIIGFVLLIGAIYYGATKFLDEYSGQVDGVLMILMVLIVGLFLLLAVGRVLRS